jgi:23S rRNA (guanosine2251-2'-O)-methyltransferase
LYDAAMNDIVIILDRIRSAHNVGSVFRTADGVGAEKVYLVDYTPLPIDRFGRPQPEITKTSLGAIETIPWQHTKDGEEAALVAELKAAGYHLVAVEQTPASIDFRTFVPDEKVAFVFGNEVTGVSDVFLEVADAVIELPMMGAKESLNVSVTVGATLYRYR